MLTDFTQKTDYQIINNLIPSCVDNFISINTINALNDTFITLYLF